MSKNRAFRPSSVDGLEPRIALSTAGVSPVVHAVHVAHHDHHAATPANDQEVGQLKEAVRQHEGGQPGRIDHDHLKK